MIAAIYARKSTEQTGVADEQKSVLRQLEHARAFAATKGWSVFEQYEYVDDGISGAEFENRPGFLRLMNALKPKAPFQVLIMSEVSRLGREQIETAYALKQLSVAGVRCFSYLEGRELLMESATDKFLLGAVTFAADLEREKARQRTYDAMLRKAKAGHVTGGRAFGYTNVDVLDPAGRKSHVERRINAAEADVVRRIFQLRAEGVGQARIAKQLNAERAATPRSQQGRPRAWSPSSVREVLFREMYRGVITWNKSRKRNTWGQHHQTDRPAGDWITVPSEHLRIVSDELWNAAHARLAEARAVYERETHGRRRFQRDRDSKYLLTSFGRCALCGSGLHVRSRSHGGGRAFFYACTAHYKSGPEVCSHVEQWPMEEIDREVIEMIVGDMLRPKLVDEVIAAGQAMFDGPGADVDHEAKWRRELEELERQQARLTEAIAGVGEMPRLIAQLRDTERRRLELAQTAPVSRPRPLWRDVEREMRQSLADWRTTLTGDIAKARHAFRQLLSGPILFTPFIDRGYHALKFVGRIDFESVFGAEMVTSVASPTGTVASYQPSIEGEGLYRSDRRAA